MGTLVHLFLSSIFAGGAVMMHLVGNQGAFISLLTAFFFLTLVMVATAAVRAIRRADAMKKA